MGAAPSAIVFFALCPLPYPQRVDRRGGAAADAGLWHQLNGVFASAGVSRAHTVGVSIMLVGLIAGTVGLAQVVLDEPVTLPPVARRAVAVAALIWLVLALALGSVAAFAVTDGHPVAWARHTLQRTVDRVSTEGRQAAGAGQAGSRFGSLDTGRYDLWKVAARGFRERPAEGVGAGNFGAPERAIGRPFLFRYQATASCSRWRRRSGSWGWRRYGGAAAADRRLHLAARFGHPAEDRCSRWRGIGGALGYFAVHAQVDWIWQPSSCALPALLLAATAAAMLPPGRERPRPLVTGGAALLASVLAAAILIVPATLAERYLDRSYDELAAAAVSDATAPAATGSPGRADLAAAAPLRTGDTAGALVAARRAAGAEPKFWVAWQVLAETAAREAQQRRPWPRVRGFACSRRGCRSSCGPRCPARASIDAIDACSFEAGRSTCWAARSTALLLTSCSGSSGAGRFGTGRRDRGRYVAFRDNIG